MASQLLIHCLDSSQEAVVARPTEQVVSNWKEIVEETLASGSACSPLEGFWFGLEISHSRLCVDTWKGEIDGCPHVRAYIVPPLAGRELPRVTMSAVGLAFSAHRDRVEQVLVDLTNLVTHVAWGWIG